jgi:hypothetical protein
MMTLVTEDQFDIEENSVVHRPTNARFSAYPGRPEGHLVNWGITGSVLPNGDDFDREDVANLALELLRTRPSLFSMARHRPGCSFGRQREQLP